MYPGPFSEPRPEPSTDVLILGGSSFMGRALVRRLFQASPVSPLGTSEKRGGGKRKSVRVCIVNRGRPYWDDPPAAKEEGSPHPMRSDIGFIRADRKKKGYAKRIVEFMKKFHVQRWSLIVDFCAFKIADLEPLHDAGLLDAARVEDFVLISSDSVYENFVAPPTESSSSLRVPEEATEAWARKEDVKDRYGWNKLKCELYLRGVAAAERGETVQKRLRSAGPVVSTAPRVWCLRLPDVIGAEDDTNRLWSYWVWSLTGEVLLPRGEDRLPIGVVHSEDVARFIEEVVLWGPGSQAFQRVNLLCDEQLQFADFLQELHKAAITSREQSASLASMPSVSVKAVPRVRTFLPSVERSLPLSTSSMRRFGFVPTPLRSVLLSTSSWFWKALTWYPEQLVATLKQVPKPYRATAAASLSEEGARKVQIENLQSSASSSSSSDSD